MQVDSITDPTTLEKIKGQWVETYEKDMQATVFSSYEWLGTWLKHTRKPWTVLCVKTSNSGEYEAFLVLVQNGLKIEMGGNRMADYTGFVCNPEIEEQAVTIFADYIKNNLTWVDMELRDVLDPRLEIFARQFDSVRFSVNMEKDIACPYLELPDSTEAFLKKLGKGSRRNFKSAEKKIQDIENLEMEYIDDSNYKKQIDIVHRLWEKRWFKNGDSAKNVRKNIFRSCYLGAKLWGAVIYDGRKPLAGALCFEDERQRKLLSYISGYDQSYRKYSVGTAIIYETIKYAIKRNYCIYDFLRGDEEYKYRIGAQENFNHKLKIKRKDIKSRIWKCKNFLMHKYNQLRSKIR